MAIKPESVWPIKRSLEDFATGDVVISSARTIEASHISGFAGLTFEFYSLHLDEAYAKATSFEGRIAHGPLTFSISSGRVYLSGYYGMAIQNM
ncbi:MaoC dehydratase-like protein [Advenella incenata]|uniref:MaoC dehydratase-like protein n=1 Tax=Advenella incenata TaxID=267800 RepID=A0A4Q7VFV2_9BURK|nr:MaoC/PaaZ C-terminal domain-containing protein [Advenella incenata]RZT94876.1 MaoC dehydratase-like protein [Advenella incenata]